ncbi:MAG: RHS repeat-associated core domain-containing protein, partial [Pirellula sp.]
KNLRMLTDDTGMVTDEYDFDAFGSELSTSGSTLNAHRWKGESLAYYREPDAAPSLQYALHFRNYDPLTGTFPSRDPAEDDSNLYRYVKNNPLNASDPSGLAELNEIFQQLISIYGSDAEKLLRAHQASGAEISVQPEGSWSTWWGNGSSLYGTYDKPRLWAPSISIDGRLSPSEAAEQLMSRLVESTGSSGVRTSLGFGNSSERDLELYQDSLLQGYNRAVPIVKQLSEAYYKGITVVSTGADVVISVNDFYEDPSMISALGMVPLIPSTILDKAGQVVIKGPGGKWIKMDRALADKVRNMSADQLEAIKKNPTNENPATLVKSLENTPVKGWESSNLWDTSKNSALLRKNMGDTVKSGEDAHHIVQSTHPRAAASRKLFDKYQIDINDAVNGVGLKPYGTKPAHHGHGLHSHAGIDEVNRRLEDAVRGSPDWATGRQRVLDELAKLKGEIAGGTFP